MPSASQLYSGSYLTSADLGALGQRRTAAIHDVAVEVIGQEQKHMLTLALVSAKGQPWPKRIVLNKSNTMQLVAMYGDDYSLWPGQTIEVWAENVMFQGRMVPGIRIRPAPRHNGGSMPAPDMAGAVPAGPVSAAQVAGLPPVAAPPAADPPSLDDEIPF